MMKELTKGIFRENPLFIIVLGLCPALAVSTQVINALGMGASVIFVLLGSNFFISLLRKIIPDNIRIPCYVVVIASFVTIVDMVLAAYVPVLSRSLGIYIPLIVVNCIILGRAEAYANKNTVGRSLLDAIGMGLGYTLSLLIVATIREVLGNGTITLFAVPAIGFDGTIRIPGLSSMPARVFGLASGALLVMGYLKAFLNWQEQRKKAVKAVPETVTDARAPVSGPAAVL
jgi:Na+-translocating ferredoxin:NAD+ oxidoreductase subunit E